MINITFLYVFFAWAFFPLIWTNRVHTTRCSINGSRAHANGKVSTAAVAKSLVIFNLASALCVGYSYVGIKFRGKKIYCYTPSIMNMLHSILFKKMKRSHLFFYPWICTEGFQHFGECLSFVFSIAGTNANCISWVKEDTSCSLNNALRVRPQDKWARQRSV